MPLHVFTENLIDSVWAAPKNNDWHFGLITHQHLVGVLIAGVGGVGFPFSFGCRGKPPLMSLKTVEAYESDYCPTIISFLTRKDLEQRATELLLIPDKDALKVRQPLVQFIKNLPEPEGNSNTQRIIFWASK